MNRYGTRLCHLALAGAALATAALPASANGADPFKITNIHFETNATACDMGIQMSFDTDGISEGSVKDPNGQVVFQFGAVGGPEVTHDVTEGFQERVEPRLEPMLRGERAGRLVVGSLVKEEGDEAINRFGNIIEIDVVEILSGLDTTRGENARKSERNRNRNESFSCKYGHFIRIR